MKFTKLSLIAALAVTTAMAGDAKISGDAKIFYGTDNSGSNSLFDKENSIGDTSVSIDYTREVKDGVTLNLGVTGVSTLGLENDLVSGTWVNHGPSVVNDVVWIDTANIVLNMGKTTAVVGRQELDTPFFKSEKWNIAANTFDAAVLVNSDIQDTTLVGAWVGRGNGTSGSTVNLDDDTLGGGLTGFAGTNPAYAVGIINKSIPNTRLQLWGYKIPHTATAQWVQADIAATKEISVGLQYAGTDMTNTSGDAKAYGAKIAYEGGPLSASLAYSKADDDNAGVGISNIATGYGTGSESSLYTEAYWNLGFVGQAGAKAFAGDVAYDLGAAQLGLRYVDSDALGTANDLQEAALTLSTKVGPLNADLAYIDGEIDGESTNTALIMLTAPFSL